MRSGWKCAYRNAAAGGTACRSGAGHFGGVLRYARKLVGFPIEEGHCGSMDKLLRKIAQIRLTQFSDSERGEHRTYQAEMQTMKLVIVGVLMSLGLCSGQESESQQKPLSVCEVLQQRVELTGRFETLRGEYKNAPVERIISVRGEVKSGGHGAYLVAEPSCTFKLTTPGTIGPNGLTIHWTWPNVIYLEYANNKSDYESTRAPFEVDWGSVRRTERQAQRQGYNHESDQLFETFTGLLVSFDRLDLPPASPAAPILKRQGFGPCCLDAPAKLLIKSEADVAVIRKRKK